MEGLRGGLYKHFSSTTTPPWRTIPDTVPTVNASDQRQLTSKVMMM
jgi:hypothetical protein